MGAGSLNETGDKSAAKKAYLQALALDAACAEAAVGLGLLHVEQRQYKEGARLLGIAVDQGSATAPIYACLAQTRYLLGEFAGASAAFAQAVRLCPGDVLFVQRYARVRLIETVIESPVDEAIAVYRAIAGDHAEDILTVCRAAFQALGGYGHHEAAIRLGRALLERVPGDPVIGFHLDALTGCACDRAPMHYLTASFDKYAVYFDKHLVEVLDYQDPAKIHSLLGSGMRHGSCRSLPQSLWRENDRRRYFAGHVGQGAGARSLLADAFTAVEAAVSRTAQRFAGNTVG